MTRAAGALGGQGKRAQLTVVLLVLVVAAVVGAGSRAAGAFERAVAPELGKRTRLIGVIVRAELQRALEQGMPLDAISGLDRYLSQTLGRFAEVERIVVRAANGSTVASAERNAGPTSHALPAVGSYRLIILDGNRGVGEIQIDVNPAFVRTRLREIVLDVLAVGLVAALVALELALLLTAVSVARPLERVSRLVDAQREGDFRDRVAPGGIGALARVADRLNDHATDLAERLAAIPAALRADISARLQARIAEGRPALLRLADVGDIRIALFAFCVATEVAVAFLPVYARSMARPPWLNADLAAAAPLIAYLLAAAIFTPLAGWLAARVGARRLFLISVLPTMLALAGLAGAEHVFEVTLWRAVMAIFYTTATVASQEYALRAGAAQGSTRPLGAFVAVVYSGVFCGAALGGVVAGRLGAGAALYGGVAIALLAGLVGALMMRGPAGDPGRIPAPVAAATAARRDPRLWVLVFGIAAPMSATTAVFVWYLTPLMLTAAGSGPAEVARVVMLYYLAAVLLGPVASTLSDGRTGPRPLVFAGAGLAALALASLSWWGGFWATVAAMCALGTGHALLRAPLYALAQRVDAGRGTAVGALRLAERLGAIVGLASCAWALPRVGAETGLLVLAMLTLAGLMLGAATLARAHRP
ncbi:MFS transporter [Piscinibacter sp.]|uniref:MFS transporter n=1 Tax=Piscinibacter sp. TaxID=1903157 RepID=UPI002CD2EC53|nr:MFS transporter [Albitalea sp.]HUG22011.1 MFS transporter [Albitalea sp.]